MKYKRLFSTLLTTSLLIGVGVSCKEDTEPAAPVTPVGDVQTKDIKVEIPEGSSFNPKESEILSFWEAFPIGGGGSTKVVSTPGTLSVAYVFDASDNLVLAGVISDSVSVVSPQSTAIVLLSHAMGASMREEGFTPLFIEQVNDLPQAVEWQEQFTELWKNDPLILEKGGYTEQLRLVMEKLVPEPITVESQTKAKVSDIVVDEGDIKSGIQVFEGDLGQFSVNNNYRRRAHGFLYKMSYRDNNGQSYEVLSSVGASSTSDMDFAIPPAGKATSALGVLGSVIEGKQGNIAVKEVGPFTLELGENESEATY